jgi:plastocyanin
MRIDTPLRRGALAPLFIACLLLSPLATAQWTAAVGKQDSSMGRQALAFLPNEIWIHVDDNVTWTLKTDEPHTITLLAPKQIRPSFAVGCPGFSGNSAVYDGTTCVTSNVLSKGQGLTVVFTKPGNFRVACLLHENMEGVVHVLEASQPLPHDQKYYDKEATAEEAALLNDDILMQHHAGSPNVIVGAGEIISTPGGSQTLSVMRFLHGNVTVHVGDTVEFNADDPITPHTITFGNPPNNPVPPSKNVTLDPDGARHVTLQSPSDSANSGFVQASYQDRQGLPQSMPGRTRFRVTFASAGTYQYYCLLHGVIGMTGTITVVAK